MFILATVQSTADRILEYLTTPNKIVGIILATLGFALSLLAKRITKVARKSDKVKDNDPLYLILLGISLVLILVGFVLTVFN